MLVWARMLVGATRQKIAGKPTLIYKLFSSFGAGKHCSHKVKVLLPKIIDVLCNF